MEPTIEELVNDLFQERRKPDGGEYSNQEVAKALGVDSSYVGKLRNGKIPNPGRDTLKKLCLFFQVPAAYFFPELEQMDELPMEQTQSQLRAALRASGLAREAQQYVEGLVDLLRRMSQQ